jgi:hypothetical protein
MTLVPLEVKLARYHAAKRAARKRRAAVRRKARLKEVLRMARAALGWKPGGPKSGKLSPEHKAALHAGRDRYHQAKRVRLYGDSTTKSSPQC